MKTKPTQHSVKQLQEVGIQPDILVLRTEHTLSSDILRKVALFCNVSAESVVQSVDVPTIYQVPLALGEQHLDEIVLKKSGITPEAKPELKEWKKFLALREEAKDVVTIASSVSTSSCRMPTSPSTKRSCSLLPTAAASSASSPYTARRSLMRM